MNLTQASKSGDIDRVRKLLEYGILSKYSISRKYYSDEYFEEFSNEEFKILRKITSF
jgi:hypothetical protein